MTTPPRPWWYSGDEESSTAELPTDYQPTDDQPAASGGLDWLSLLSSAQRMVDWATEKVMTPHAEHDDPAQYPDCVVCRALVLIGSSGAGPGVGPAPSPEGVHPAAPIEWIPIRDAGTEAVTAG